MSSLRAALLCCLAAAGLATKPNEAEIVLARCREDISWVDQMGYADITTVYAKCGVTDGRGRHVSMPNVGREGGTYVQHIVDRYDTLADWTVFSQAGEPTYGYRGHRLGGGHMMSNVRFQDYIEAAKTRHEIPRFFMYTTVLMMKNQRIYQNIRKGYGEQYIQPTTNDQVQKMCGTKEDWPQWFEFPDWFTGMVMRLQGEQQAPYTGFDSEATMRLFDIWPTDGVVFFAQGARFGLSREAIQQRPKAYYENLLPLFNHPDPWAGYFMEWLWWYVLAGQDAPCQFEKSVAQSFAEFTTPSTPKLRGVVVQQAPVSGVSGSISPIDCLLTSSCPSVITTDATLEMHTWTNPIENTGLTIAASITVDTPAAEVCFFKTKFGNCRDNDITGSEITIQDVTVEAGVTLNGPTNFGGAVDLVTCAKVYIYGNLDYIDFPKVTIAAGTWVQLFFSVTDASKTQCSGEGKVYLRATQFKRRGTIFFGCDLETGDTNSPVTAKFQRQAAKFQRQATGSTIDICGPFNADITINTGDTLILNLLCTAADGGNMVQTGVLTLNTGSLVHVDCSSAAYTPPSTTQLVVAGSGIPLTLTCTVPTGNRTWTLLTYGSATGSGSFTVSGCAAGCSCVATVGTTALTVQQTCPQTSGDSGSSTDSGLIIGAVVGSVVGAAALCCCALLAYLLYRRRGSDVLDKTFDPYNPTYQMDYQPYHQPQQDAFKVPPTTPTAYF